MLPRVLETEAMDTAAEAIDYDRIDHVEVNGKFVAPAGTEVALNKYLELAPNGFHVADVKAMLDALK